MRRFLALLAGYGAWRLGELALSARHARALERRGVLRRRERGFGWMVAAQLVPFVVAPIEAARAPRPPSRALVTVAGAALAGAGALRLWALATLGPSWNVRVRAAPGMAIVDRGPYRWVRHPNYTAVAIELAALPLVGGAWISAALSSLLGAIALGHRVRDEEAALALSDAWRARMAGKPRFLPRLPLSALRRPARAGGPPATAERR